LTVNAINFELPAPPAICKSTTEVLNGTEVEKYLCHVKQELSAYGSRLICENNGMRLYQPRSSKNARAGLIAFGKKYFGGSRKAKFYVHGRQGNLCQTATGNGVLGEIQCNTNLNPLCEYFDVKHLLCDSEDPEECVYESAITEDNMEMYVASPATYEEVKFLIIEDVEETLFLPVDLAITFPNLEEIASESCSIATLNRRTFAGLKNLTFIDLDYNKITEIRSSIFEGLTSLKRLDLGETEFFDHETSIFG
jgi:hypothetical protein